MPLPTGFDNTVRHVTNTPVAAADLNTELSTQNGNGYWCTDIKFLDADNALLLFVVYNGAAYGYNIPQKVNAVTATQAALNADKATEAASGYYPTGVFVSGGTLFILYSQLNDGGS